VEVLVKTKVKDVVINIRYLEQTCTLTVGVKSRILSFGNDSDRNWMRDKF
jgi:hypothetical protein